MWASVRQIWHRSMLKLISEKGFASDYHKVGGISFHLMSAPTLKLLTDFFPALPTVILYFYLVFLLDSISSLFSTPSLMFGLLEGSLTARVGGMMGRSTSQSTNNL